LSSAIVRAIVRGLGPRRGIVAAMAPASAEALERLERSVRQLGELHASIAAATDPESSCSPASLDEAEAELDDFRGQLLSMAATPAADPQRLQGELASLRRELHVQRAGSAAAIACLEKELRRARRGARGAVAPASEWKNGGGADTTAPAEAVPASDSQGSEVAMSFSQLPESGATDEQQADAQEQGGSWWQRL
jgi:hypothetical protein